jgi:hypothetical protein
MADDSLKPPLTRRVPGAARCGPRSTTRPVLPDALLKRMQAAVDAARANRDKGQVQPGMAGIAGTAPRVTRRAATPLLPVQSAPPSARTSPPVTTPQVTTPPVTTPPVTTPPVTTPPVTTPPVTTPPVTTPPVTSRPVPIPPPRRSAPRRPGRRGPRVAGTAALGVVVFAAGAVAATLWARATGVASPGTRSHSTAPNTSPRSSAPPSSPPPRTQSPSPAAVAANLAATWVATQIGHDQYVACDKAMCDALTAHGFPGRKLQLIRPHSHPPVHAQVVVVTPVVARQFASNPAAKWAPAVLTRVGSGTSAIFIRVVSSQGAGAYNSALSKDVQQRKSSAQHLLRSAHVKASAAARSDLAQGRVDARLIVVLTSLAALHPIQILGFGTAYADATPGIPLRQADLAPSVAASNLKWSAYVGFLRKVLAAEPATYRPHSAALTHNGANTLVFRIDFSAPSPLHLVGP